MTGIQHLTVLDADQADLSPPDWQAAIPRLEALQRLKLKILPTARVVRWAYIMSGVFAAAALVWLAAGGAYWFAVLVCAVALCEFVLGRERARSIRTGNLGAGTLERLLDHRATDSALTAGEIVAAMLDNAPDEIVKAGGGSLTPIARRFGDRYVRFAQPFLRRYRLPLCPGERPLVIAAGFSGSVTTPVSLRLVFSR